MQSPRDSKMRAARKTLRLCAHCMGILPRHAAGCTEKDSVSPRVILRQREGVYARPEKSLN